jgi:carbon storage regulator
MLVLTRKPGEKLRIGDPLVLGISILRVEAGKVSLELETSLPLTLMPGDVEIGSEDAVPVRISRRLEDSVLAGGGVGEIEVKIVSVKGEQVRIGIRAPRELGVYREEVWQEIRQQNEAASEAVDIDPAQLRRLLQGKSPRPRAED